VKGPASVTEYVYDAEGRRVAKGSLSSWPTACVAPTTANGFTLTASYVLGLGGEQVSELNGSGAWQHTNVFANGTLLATCHDSDTYCAFNDWLGTKRAEYTPDAKFSTFSSLPYGDFPSTSGNATDATEHHFTGKERDAESGNDYFEARYFGSSMGRFLIPDPSGLVYADPKNPQSLNLYGGWRILFLSVKWVPHPSLFLAKDGLARTSLIGRVPQVRIFGPGKPRTPPRHPSLVAQSLPVSTPHPDFRPQPPHSTRQNLRAALPTIFPSRRTIEPWRKNPRPPRATNKLTADS